MEYSCDNCSEGFLTLCQLKDHIKSVHECKHCFQLLSSKQRKNLHEKRYENTNYRCRKKKNKFVNIPKELPKDLLKCNACQLTFSSMNLFVNHIEGTNRKFALSCDKTFTSESKKEMHESEEHILSFPCDICNTIFTSVNMLTYHKNRFHFDKRPFTCDICCVSFYTEKRLMEHKSIHENDEKYSCHVCQALFYNFDCLSIHKQREHKIFKEKVNHPQIKCKFCIFTSDNFVSLSQHQCKGLQGKQISMIPELKEYFESSVKHNFLGPDTNTGIRTNKALNNYRIKEVTINLNNIGYNKNLLDQEADLDLKNIDCKRQLSNQPVVNLRNKGSINKLSKQPFIKLKSIKQLLNEEQLSNFKSSVIEHNLTVNIPSQSHSPNKSCIFINASVGVNSEEYKAFYDDIKTEAIDVDDFHNCYGDVNDSVDREATPHFLVDIKKEDIDQIKEEKKC